MKEIKQRFLLISILLISIVSGCKKWAAINYDTNNVVESNVSPSYILPSSLISSANMISHYNFLFHWMGYWCPPADAVQDIEEQCYNLKNSVANRLFNSHYKYSVNYDLIEKKARESGQGLYQAIAKTMKAYHYTALVDLFNNVPYSESLQGNTHLTPVYEDGKLIYEESIKQLDSSIYLIRNTSLDKNIQISSADIIFKADTAKWIRFINTLKLRLLLHQANASDRLPYVQSEFQKLIAGNAVFLETGMDAAVKPGYQLTSGKTNFYYNYYGFDVAGNPSTTGVQERANVFVLDILKTDKDPRLNYFYKAITQSVPLNGAEPFPQLLPANYRGNRYGLPINPTVFPYQGANYTSAIGIGLIKSYNMPMWIVTSVESLFLLAEAIQRGLIPGDPKAAYLNAIKESFIWLNVNGGSSSAITAFNNWYSSQSGNQNVNWDISSDKHKLIMYQKYLALNGIAPLEVWTDYRRNNSYPNIPISLNPANTATSLPIRLLYPNEEYAYNSINVLAQGSISQFNNKIWWMP